MPNGRSTCASAARLRGRWCSAQRARNRGTLALSGQPFEIEDAIIEFDGDPLDARINLTAVRDTAGPHRAHPPHRHRARS
jgi:hypothetical protein